MDWLPEPEPPPTQAVQYPYELHSMRRGINGKLIYCIYYNKTAWPKWQKVASETVGALTVEDLDAPGDSPHTIPGGIWDDR